MALPQYCAPGGSAVAALERNLSRHRTPGTFDDDKSIPEDNEPSGGTFHSGKWYGPSVSTSVAPGTLIEQVLDMLFSYFSYISVILQIESVAGSNTFEEDSAGLSKDRNSSSLMSPKNSESNSLTNTGDDMEQSAAHNLQWLVQECGVTPQKISELLKELPDLAFSNVLVDFFFTSM